MLLEVSLNDDAPDNHHLLPIRGGLIHANPEWNTSQSSLVSAITLEENLSPSGRRNRSFALSSFGKPPSSIRSKWGLQSAHSQEDCPSTKTAQSPTIRTKKHIRGGGKKALPPSLPARKPSKDPSILIALSPSPTTDKQQKATILSSTTKDRMLQTVSSPGSPLEESAASSSSFLPFNDDTTATTPSAASSLQPPRLPRRLVSLEVDDSDSDDDDEGDNFSLRGSLQRAGSSKRQLRGGQTR
jgi:hypothetical protein